MCCFTQPSFEFVLLLLLLHFLKLYFGCCTIADLAADAGASGKIRMRHKIKTWWHHEKRYALCAVLDTHFKHDVHLHSWTVTGYHLVMPRSIRWFRTALLRASARPTWPLSPDLLLSLSPFLNPHQSSASLCLCHPWVSVIPIRAVVTWICSDWREGDDNKGWEWKVHTDTTVSIMATK